MHNSSLIFRARGILLLAARVVNFRFPNDDNQVDAISKQQLARWVSEWESKIKIVNGLTTGRVKHSGDANELLDRKAGSKLPQSLEGELLVTFPYPVNPEDWQAAYTRVQAQRDSNKFGNGCAAMVTLGFLVILFYISVLQFFIFSKYSILIVALSILFFTITMIIPFRFASRFLTEFYCPPNNIDLFKIIKYRLFGKFKLLPPLNIFSQFEYIIARDGEIYNKDEWIAWSARNLGGPIMLRVFDGCALYIERSNCFSRVVGPGVSFLEWFETIKYVVDLRSKVKADRLAVWTKDGIKIAVTAQIEFRIGDPSKNNIADKLTYPYDPVAIKKAVERSSLRWPLRLEGEPSEFTWIDATWGQVSGIVPDYIGSRTLDDLFIADRYGGQLLSPKAIEAMTKILNQATNGYGVFVTDFQILEVDLPKEVREQLIRYWKAKR